MNRKLVLWVTLSTALWIVVGGLGTYLMMFRQAETETDQMEEIQESLSILNLNPQQKREIDKIIRDYQELAVQADRDFWSTVNAAEREADSRIEAVLTEEQKQRYFAEVLAQR